MPSHREKWTIEPSLRYLNHGSFGACPREVLEFQSELRARMERQLVRFFVSDLEAMLDDALASLAAFLGAHSEDLAFVRNATSGVNAVLRSLEFNAGDELLTTNHEYNACVNAMRYAASRAGASVVIAEVPVPVRTEDELVEAILSAVTDRTRLAVLSHVTSPTAIVFPMARIVKELDARGIDTLVDGAHAPGMIDVNLGAMNAAYCTGNLHKWVCAPKGAAYLHVRRDKQEGIVPTSVSHAYNSVRTDRSMFRQLFAWTGTDDPTPCLTVPKAIEAMGAMLPGGWDALRAHNHALATNGARHIAERIGGTLVAPPGLCGSIATFTIPDTKGPPPISALFADPLHDRLRDEFRIEVPVIPWPTHPQRVMRVSGQIYNDASDYEALADALVSLFAN